MHMITVLVGNSSWLFNFKHPHEADKLCVHLKKALEFENRERLTVEIEDDFGSKAVLRGDQINAFQRTDVALAFEGQGIVALIQARAQGKLQAMAQRDPTLLFLNAAAAPPNGSGIIRPNG